jgi:hypothetical protein
MPRNTSDVDCIFKVSLKEWRAKYKARKAVEPPLVVLYPPSKRTVHLRASGDFSKGRKFRSG